MKTETVDIVIVVCCSLHNMLRNDYLSTNPSDADRTPNVDGFPNQNLLNLAGKGGFARADGSEIRQFTDYFSTHRYMS